MELEYMIDVGFHSNGEGDKDAFVLSQRIDAELVEKGLPSYYESGMDGGYRDLQWYELTLQQATAILLTVTNILRETGLHFYIGMGSEGD